MANCIIGYGLPGCGYVKFLKNLEKSLDNLTIVNIKKLYALSKVLDTSFEEELTAHLKDIKSDRDSNIIVYGLFTNNQEIINIINLISDIFDCDLSFTVYAWDNNVPYSKTNCERLEADGIVLLEIDYMLFEEIDIPKVLEKTGKSVYIHSMNTLLVNIDVLDKSMYFEDEYV